DQLGGAPVGDRSPRPAERSPRGIARQRPHGLAADGRKGIKRIGHASSNWFCRLLCLGPSVVPMLTDPSITKSERGTANLTRSETSRTAGAFWRPPQLTADCSAAVPCLRRAARAHPAA